MDPIISKLNQQAIQKLQNNIQQSGPYTQEPSQFQQKFDNTMADRMLERIREDYGANQKDITVLSAENINVTTKRPEMGGMSPSATEKYYDMFKDMNRDLLSLDSAIETLTTPGTRITPRQLLAFQAGIGSTMIMAEGFSRFTEAISRGIQTVVQTQV